MCQSVDSWYVWATRKIVASSKGLPAICSPIGRFSEVNPQLIESAGRLAKLNGAVKLRLPAKLSTNSSLLPRPSRVGRGEAGMEDVGITKTSTSFRASSICCRNTCLNRIAFWWAWAGIMLPANNRTRLLWSYWSTWSSIPLRCT